MKALFDKNEYYSEEAREIAREADKTLHEFLAKFPKCRVRDLEFLLHHSVSMAAARELINRRRAKKDPANLKLPVSE